MIPELPMEERALILRSAALFLPLVPAWLAMDRAWLRTEAGASRRRLLAAHLLAGLCCASSLLALHVLAQRMGWWRFEAAGGLALGMPGEMLLGWTLLWSTLPLALAPRAPLWRLLVILAGLDILGMPRMQPLLQLDPSWWAGEILGLGLCLLPAQFIGRWTLEGRRLYGRAALQVLGFALIGFWLIPTLILEGEGRSWAILAQRSPGLLAAGLIGMAVASIPGLWAVLAFARDGGGTPFPLDPPRRLVTRGPYAFVANPMQLSACLMWPILALLLGSPGVAWMAPVGIFFSLALDRADERLGLQARFGDDHATYRARVRPWLPRIRLTSRPGARPNHPGGLQESNRTATGTAAAQATDDQRSARTSSGRASQRRSISAP